MSPTRSYRALAALLCIVSCNRAPAPSTHAADSTRPDSSLAPGASSPASAPADSSVATSSRPSAPAVAPVDSPPATKPKPSKPATSAKPAPATKPADTTTAPTQAAADAPLRDAYHTAPLDTVDAKTYQGWKLFNLNCSRCHGEDVNGTTIAPHLIMSLKPDGPIPDEATFQTTVCGGRVAKGMPAWCALGMTPATIDTIYSYVKGRSDAKIHPGRPARKS